MDDDEANIQSSEDTQQDDDDQDAGMYIGFCVVHIIFIQLVKMLTSILYVCLQHLDNHEDNDSENNDNTEGNGDNNLQPNMSDHAESNTIIEADADSVTPGIIKCLLLCVSIRFFQ